MNQNKPVQQIYRGATSACFELRGRNPYYARMPYTLFLDGEEIKRGDSNVFSLFSLHPGRDYRLTVRFDDGEEEELSFSTDGESCAVDVRDFGAKGDGMTDDTRAIQTAIYALPASGRLVFPAGDYLSAPLFLKSHMTLELQEGARLVGSTNRADYPVIPGVLRDCECGQDVYFGGFEGNAVPMYQSLLTASYAEDI
ncbi:MAG: glycoside hydrolase family 28 protein, partial [Oscillospiraceae bacterium]|nr:glycoside hydrolase family 28 protein [Oscillospiraceae bacterium]